MLKLGPFLQQLLRTGFGTAASPQPEPPQQRHFPTPESVVFPGADASLEEHVRFLLDARHYVRNHPAPEDRTNSINQYSHSKSDPIGGDITKPAMTNCSYDHYGRSLMSVGFPLFIHEAPLIKEGQLNPAFNAATFWESFERLVKHYTGPLGDGDSKFGYYEPINHRYIERPVPQDIFDKSQIIIETFTRSEIEDPKAFLAELNTKMQPARAPAVQGHNRIGNP